VTGLHVDPDPVTVTDVFASGITAIMQRGFEYMQAMYGDTTTS
jgi:hypothetical protein